MASQGAAHPYAPQDLKLPGFVPIFYSQSYIVGVFVFLCFLVVLSMWIFSGFVPKISKTDRVLMCWWIFTALIHLVLEGYFAFTPDFYQKTSPVFPGELWKEYSKGDSRYVGRDAAIVSVEGITAVIEGPASLLAVYAIAAKKSYRHVLQLAICVGQLYGTAVYFATAILEGDNFSTSPFYYYAYYIFTNHFWVWIPTLIVIHCWKKICAAVKVHEQKTKTR